MRIALTGGGTLDLEGATRDGSIGDRRELMTGIEELGHEAIYVGPKRFTPNDDRVLDWDWRGEVDALVMEVRFSFFPPKNLALWDEYLQGLVLEAWRRGEFGSAKLFLVDFDAQARRVLGLAGRKSSYHHVNANLRRRDLPELDLSFLERVWAEATVLAPYEPSASLLERKRVPGHAYRVERWLWPYPRELEVEPMPWADRECEMFYPGSDYNRREKFWKFYAKAAHDGARVRVSGTWKDSRKGDEAPPWKGRDFRKRVLGEAAGNLQFLNSGMRNMPYLEVHRQLRRAKTVVQIVSNVGERRYEDTGYYTIRPAETAAAGVVPFVDRDIKYHEDIVPDDFYRVSSHEEVFEKMRELRGMELDAVMRWREHLRKVGAGVERARQLLEMI